MTNETPESTPVENSPDVLIRGGRPLDPAELPGHLALALRLENVGVLLGSGASVSAGGLTMGQLWGKLVSADTNLVPWLKKEGFLPGASGEPNVEDILGALQIAILDAARRKADGSELEARLEQIRRAVVSAAMLDASLWKERDQNDAQMCLSPYIQLLARLQGSRQPGQSAPWVFTTNYDLSVEWAAEQLGIHVVNGFIGLHQRRFQSNAFDLSLQNTRATGEARFGSYNLNLVKLHGSLSWSVTEGDVAVEIPCGQIKTELDQYLIAADGKSLPSLLIHPSAAKYVDTVGFIYGELVRRLTEYLSQPNTTLIICGYGFEDAHINRMIASGLLNPTLQIVIYHSEWKNAEEQPQNEFIRHLKSLGLPRVIIRGGGRAAYFEQLIQDLPDPAMIDELPAEARRLLTQLARGIRPAVGEAQAKP